MGKNIIVALFILMVMSAVYIFVGRESSLPLPELEPGQQHLPRIQLEEFTVYKYEGHKVLSTLSGKTAFFLDPNTLDVLGSIQGQSLDSPNKEFFTAESLRVTFAAKGLSDLLKNSRIQRTEIENQVRFGYQDHILFTEYAKYLNDQSLLVSDLPVQVKGPRMTMKGAKGFEYNTETTDLKLYGPLEGALLGTGQ